MAEESNLGFRFGLEVEFLLADADTFRPLWHPDLTFTELNDALEGIPADDLPPLTGLKIEPPHRKCMPFCVEGYHVPDPDFKPIDLLPKGIEIRVPVCSSIDECLMCLWVLHGRLQEAMKALGYRPVVQSFHPIEHRFEGPQNKRRYDFWQWAMEAMVTYGPDVNVSLPPRLAQDLNQIELDAKVNYYAPALTALTAASPLYRGDFWRIRGRIGKSVRTYYRSVTAPPLEIHPSESLRLELKPLETSWRLEDYQNYFLLWLELLLDDGLRGRASKETRIYDMGAVARYGVNAETVTERVQEVLDRAPETLARWGFDAAPLQSYRQRLDTGRVPADEIIEVFEKERSIPVVLQRFAGLKHGHGEGAVAQAAAISTLA